MEGHDVWLEVHALLSVQTITHFLCKAVLSELLQTQWGRQRVFPFVIGHKVDRSVGFQGWLCAVEMLFEVKC